MRRTRPLSRITVLAICTLTIAVGQEEPEVLTSADIATPMEPGQTFSDDLSSGGQGPEMVVIPAGNFQMGCVSGQECGDYEMPVHNVTIPQSFAVSTHEITFDDFDRLTYPNIVEDEGWGRGRRPVINLSWSDAQEYVAWLSRQTGRTYRLLSEAEWEYVARAGSSSAYNWGNEIGENQANCKDWSELDHGTCSDPWPDSAPVGSFQPNEFGVYDMHGNVWEWVEDCWNDSYSSAPSDGSAWRSGNCSERVLRGGSWFDNPWFLRSAYRFRFTAGPLNYFYGLRVARTLTR